MKVPFTFMYGPIGVPKRMTCHFLSELQELLLEVHAQLLEVPTHISLYPLPKEDVHI